MRGLWRWWEERCSRQADPLPMAWVRVLLCGVSAIQLLHIGWLGLVTWHWRPEAGGLSARHDPMAFVDNISVMWGGPVTWAVTVVAFSLAALGVFTRPMMLIALIGSAQLGHLGPSGERAIDRIVRTNLVLLLVSGSHLRLSVVHWLRGKAPVRLAPAWPNDLLRYLLVLIYLSAGFNKLGAAPGWVDWRAYRPMERILTDPVAGRLDAGVFSGETWGWVFYLMGLATLCLELSAPLILTRWMRWWAIAGALMHVGIILTMRLGYFGYGMLALYPVLLWPWFSSTRRNQADRADRADAVVMPPPASSSILGP